MIFTDMAREELLQAMRKKDIRISATELMGQPVAKLKPTLREKARTFVLRMRERYRSLRDWAVDGIRQTGLQPERGLQHGYSR